MGNTMTVNKPKPVETITLPVWECNRCSHRWVPRKTEIPAACPKCKSPRWNRPKVEKNATKSERD